MKYLILLLLVLGCSSRGFNKGQLFVNLNQNTIVRGEDIKEVLESKAQLPNPFKLAVHFEMARDSQEKAFKWRMADKKKVIGSLSSLEKKVSSIQELIVPLGAPTDFEKLRYYAAQQGVDALMIISGAGSVGRETNAWGITYIALIPAFFVNGTDYEGVFVAQAMMYDVRNSHLYFGAQADGEAKIKKPASGPHDHKVAKLAKAKGLEMLVQEIEKQVSQFKD
jgi:hypothetical protein